MTTTLDLGRFIQWQAPALPALERLQARAEAILARWPDLVVTPPEKDRERLVQELKRRLEKNDWRDTPMSLVTSAARALFDEARRARPDLADLQEFYYDEISSSTRASFLDAMLEVHLGSYQQGARHTGRLASALAGARARMSARGRQLLQNVPEVLDPATAPKRIAARMVAMDDCFTDLKALGLRSPHAPGLMDHANLAYVRAMAPALKGRAALERLFGWLKPDGVSARVSGAGEAITAVLAPWANDTPSQADVTWITETLIGLYGDPRVSSGGAWAGVPADLLAVIMRWLTGENIRFFLDIVSAVEDGRMWEPRRRFWLGLHEQKRIDAAWVAFSDDAAEHARRRLRAHEGRGTLSFGRQAARGNRVDTSLLIMKIGTKIIVEGSHMYRVHIFSERNQSAPKLYQPRYDCEVIRALPGSEVKTHYDSSHYREGASIQSPRAESDWRVWVIRRI